MGGLIVLENAENLTCNENEFHFVLVCRTYIDESEASFTFDNIA